MKRRALVFGRRNAFTDFRAKLLKIEFIGFGACLRDQLIHFVANRRGRFFPDRQLFCVCLPFLGRSSLQIITLYDACKKGAQTIEIGLKDVIELVIMALSAAHSQTHQGKTVGFGNVCQDLLAPLEQIRGVILIRIEPIESRSNDGLWVIPF